MESNSSSSSSPLNGDCVHEHVCVCVCVCVWREKGRGALKKASSLKSNTMYYFIAVNLQEAFDFKSKLLILRSSLPVCSKAAA